MSGAPTRVVLVGSLRDVPDPGALAAEHAGDRRVALVTAGWQEWEEDDADLRAGAGEGVVNLRLYARASEVWAEDPELTRGHRELQDQVRALRRSYNLRLAHAMGAWIELLDMPGSGPVLQEERISALEAVKALDRHHGRRLAELRDAFYRRFDPLNRGAVARRRHEITEELDGVGAVLIAGGHVPVLLNRLRLFGVDQLLGGRTVVASAGGAMALSDRVVLFHDSPPWGPGHAEVGEVGMGLYPDVVALPDPSVRLSLDDPGRVSRMALRFAPETCVLLEPGTRVEWDAAAAVWKPHGARRLTAMGTPASWEVAA